MPEDAAAFIEGADRLVAVYGQWITFHDAAVESVLIERVGPTVTIWFLTNDVVSPEVGGGSPVDGCRRARVEMRWHEACDLVLSGVDADENNWIGSLKLVRRGDLIHTVLEQMDGTHGSIVAPRVEVVTVELLPAE